MSRAIRSVAKAENWLINSGIRNTMPGNLYGSFNAWYDIEKQKYSFAYPEITGYAISELLYLNSINPHKKYIQYAKDAADWLINETRDIETSALKYKYDFNAEEFSSLLYSFDNGMCITGLMELYKTTNEKKYLIAANKISNWLLNDMQKNNGDFYPTYDTKMHKYKEQSNIWSLQSGSFHAKLIIGLLYMNIEPEQIKKIASAAKKYQTTDGRFITNTTEQSTYMHPHCYSMEGLLAIATQNQDADTLKVIISALQWALNGQLNTGGIPCDYSEGKFSNDERTDSLAQIIRLYIYLSSYKYIEYDSSIIEPMIDRLLSFQCHSIDKHNNGGFYYGETDGTLIPHISAHATIFAIQALIMWENKKNIKQYNII